MKATTELELKCAANPAALSKIKAHLIAGGFRIGIPHTVRFTTTYGDSPDFWYYRKGWALRLRQKRSQLLISLKARASAPGRVSHRKEFEESHAIILSRFEIPDGKIKKLLLKWRAPLDILPLFQIQTQRTIYPCRAANGCRLELTFDRCVIKRGRTRKGAFQEIEIEHAGGSSSYAKRVLEKLASQPFVHASLGGKFDRGVRAARIRLPRA